MVVCADEETDHVVQSFLMHKRKRTVIDAIGEVTKPLSATVEKFEKKIDATIAPERTSALRRYPLLFTLLVAFGVCTVYYGFERLVDQIAFLSTRPLLMIAIGSAILILTGTLYKKL